VSREWCGAFPDKIHGVSRKFAKVFWFFFSKKNILIALPVEAARFLGILGSPTRPLFGAMPKRIPPYGRCRAFLSA
jgi:hypothetical protein